MKLQDTDGAPRPAGRRAFGAVIRAAAVLAVVTLMAACAPAAAPEATDSGQAGGILKIAIASDPPSLDPVSNTTGRVLTIIGPSYNGLVQYDPLNPSEIIGDLATDWSWSDDGKTLTFTIVDNATWHDGEPLTAEDVAYTFDYIRNPPEGVTSPRAGLFAGVESIEAADDTTVEFHLSAPAPSFLGTLASGWMLVLPKHILESGETLENQVVGSGPYKLETATRGVSFELVRNDDYFVPDRPYLDGITFYVVPDEATIYANLATGAIDYYENMPVEDAERAQVDLEGDVVISSAPALGFDSLMFNTTQAPWDDVRVRTAVALALDRQEAIDVVRNGKATIGGTMLPSGEWSVDESVLDTFPGYSGDHEDNLDEARELLEDAGYEDGFAANLLTRKEGISTALAVLVKDQLADIGIELTLDPQDDAAAYEALQNRTFEVATWAHGLPSDDPDAIYGQYFLCDGDRNYPGLCIDGLDDLFEEQSQTIDASERKAIVNQMEELVQAEVPQVILYWRTRYLGLSAGVRDLILHPTLDNNRRMQNVWLETE